MKLYYAPAACSMAVHIAANEAGVKLDLGKVEFGPSGKTVDGVDFTTINPKGAVPALDIGGGEILTEVAVLLQYVAAQAPGSSLIPQDGLARWRQLELLNFVSSEIHKGFAPLWNPATPPEVREAAIQNLGKKFSVLEAKLAKSDYLTGDTFTAADAYAFTVVNWTNHHKVDISAWPKLTAFMARVAARPAVQQTLKEEGLA